MFSETRNFMRYVCIGGPCGLRGFENRVLPVLGRFRFLATRKSKNWCVVGKLKLVFACGASLEKRSGERRRKRGALFRQNCSTSGVSTGGSPFCEMEAGRGAGISLRSPPALSYQCPVTRSVSSNLVWTSSSLVRGETVFVFSPVGGGTLFSTKTAAVFGAGPPHDNILR